ncbi:protein translocase subunit SecD [Stakelama tenebrarum]|uniref:Protein translocase subunit SecD n=1 Tax=Stakelama tenebrarum TaxID=2711215 RepID=A0A6G6Y309_9SPHN|nr:protein translocase subunit SecD [Sphingosinithalassobacter tenebrarum]QIG79334.1 protein translocase subunit SecD [Sphingosinithalassobacter tenebrarum]
MLDFPRWKVWLTWVAIVVCVLMAVPSLLPGTARNALPGWVPKPTVNLGLDLAGGSYLLLEGDVAQFRADRLDTMRETVRQELRGDPRIEIGDISIRDGNVSFMVRDASRVDAVRERLLPLLSNDNGQRDWDFDVVDTSRVVLTQTDSGIASAVDQAMGDATEVVRRRIDELGTREPTIIRQGSERIVVQVPGLGDPTELKDLLGRTALLEFKLVDTTADVAQTMQGIAPVGSEVLEMEDGTPIVVKRNAMITGDMLTKASQGYDQQTGAPVVQLTLNGAGTRRFARVTTEHTGEPFAIIVDDVVISAPRIDEPIIGGQARISGGFTVESANQLAIALRSGKLPIRLKVMDQSTVSPELGQDSINKGALASVLATVLVMAFMLITYFRFGVYSTVALIVNILMIIGIMGLFNATLTLPGIAGFVLTIGAAVDANVLINERIREEQRRGRGVLQSVEFGYKEATRAIFDANITNVIAAAIMFIFGSGPIRGFAVVLTIGIVTSVFTAVTFTRLMVSNWLKKRPKELVL